MPLMDRVAQLESKLAEVMKFLADQVATMEPAVARNERPAEARVNEDLLCKQAKEAEPWLVHLSPPGEQTIEVGPANASEQRAKSEAIEVADAPRAERQVRFGETTEVAGHPADAMDVDCEGDGPEHRGLQRREDTLRRIAPARADCAEEAPPRRQGPETMLESELLADSSKFAARLVRRGYLESVRGIDRSASVSEEDVAVWIRSLQGQVRSASLGLPLGQFVSHLGCAARSKQALCAA